MICVYWITKDYELISRIKKSLTYQRASLLTAKMRYILQRVTCLNYVYMNNKELYN